MDFFQGYLLTPGIQFQSTSFLGREFFFSTSLPLSIVKHVWLFIAVLLFLLLCGKKREICAIIHAGSPVQLKILRFTRVVGVRGCRERIRLRKCLSTYSDTKLTDSRASNIFGHFYVHIYAPIIASSHARANYPGS